MEKNRWAEQAGNGKRDCGASIEPIDDDVPEENYSAGSLVLLVLSCGVP